MKMTLKASNALDDAMYNVIMSIDHHLIAIAEYFAGTF